MTMASLLIVVNKPEALTRPGQQKLCQWRILVRSDLGGSAVGGAHTHAWLPPDSDTVRLGLGCLNLNLLFKCDPLLD